MSVTVQTPVNSYTANGVTTVFNFTFLLLSAADLDVYIDGVLQTLTADYSVSGLEINAGGTVTFVTAPANGANVVLQRNSDIARATDYQNNGDMLSTVVNKDFDRLWLAMQEILYKYQLAPSLIPGSPLAGNVRLPDPEVGKYLRWNALENNLENADPGFYSGTVLPAGSIVNTFADLAITPATTAGMIVYTKQHTSGGIGGGYFQDTAGTITNNGGTLINNSVTAGRHWAAINYNDLTVEMFGAGAISDDAVAFNLAIASLGGNGGTITGEKLSYTIRSQINLNANYTSITMKKGTFFNVVPAADLVVFKVEQSTGSTVLFGGSIENIIFSSSDTTYKKTAIKLIDTSGFVLRGIRSHSPHWYGAGSIGLHLLGRELCSIYDTYFFATRAVVFSPIPAPHVASGIGNDQINFHNAYLLSVGNPVVEIEDGTSITNLNFTGYQSWIGGTYGLYWVDTTSSDVSFDVNLSNIRWEQPDNNTGYAVYISHTQGVRTLRILNCYASERNGIYCRNVDFIKLDGYSFATTAKEALNVDSTCQELSIANTFTQTGSTATLGGQQLIYASSKVTTGSPLPTNATYSSTSLASYEFSVGATLTGEVLTLADTQVVKIGNTDTLEELKIAYYPIGILATFELNGTNHTVNEVRDAGGFFSNTVGTPNSINIYWSAANSQYEIQNLRGAQARLRIVRSGGHIFW